VSGTTHVTFHPDGDTIVATSYGEIGFPKYWSGGNWFCGHSKKEYTDAVSENGVCQTQGRRNVINNTQRALGTAQKETTLTTQTQRTGYVLQSRDDKQSCNDNNNHHQRRYQSERESSRLVQCFFDSKGGIHKKVLVVFISIPNIFSKSNTGPENGRKWGWIIL